MRYETRYVHKISPSAKDVGKAVDLAYRHFTVRLHPSKSLWFKSPSPVTRHMERGA